jgi:hypothetical protein
MSQLHADGKSAMNMGNAVLFQFSKFAMAGAGRLLAFQG